MNFYTYAGGPWDGMTVRGTDNIAAVAPGTTVALARGGGRYVLRDWARDFERRGEDWIGLCDWVPDDDAQPAPETAVPIEPPATLLELVTAATAGALLGLGGLLGLGVLWAAAALVVAAADFARPYFDAFTVTATAGGLGALAAAAVTVRNPALVRKDQR